MIVSHLTIKKNLKSKKYWLLLTECFGQHIIFSLHTDLYTTNKNKLPHFLEEKKYQKAT